MNLQSYIKALKQPDDEVYAEAEAKLLAMKEGAAPILQQSLDKMVERSKMQNALSGVAMIAFVLLFLGLMSFRDTLVMCAAFLVCLVLLMSALKSTLLKSVISKNFSQSEMTIAAPRLIATAVQLEVDGNLPLLFNIHQWILRYELSPRQNWNEMYADSPVMDVILTTLRKMDSEQYFRLPLSYRNYIFRLLKQHTTFLCGGEGGNNSGWIPPSGTPRSEYDLPISRAIMELYVRVGETGRSPYIKDIADSFFPKHLITAHIIKKYAEATLAVLDATPPRDMTLLRPVERPPNHEDLLTPVLAEEETELLRASEVPPKK